MARCVQCGNELINVERYEVVVLESGGDDTRFIPLCAAHKKMIKKAKRLHKLIKSLDYISENDMKDETWKIDLIKSYENRESKAAEVQVIQKVLSIIISLLREIQLNWLEDRIIQNYTFNMAMKYHGLWETCTMFLCLAEDEY